MGHFVVRRVLSGFALILALTIVTFAISTAIPSSLDPACLVVDCQTATKAEINAARHQLGVDRPFYVQYAHFVWRLVRHASFGNSFQGTPIDYTLKTTLPATASIVLGGVLLLLLLAIPLGLISALRAHTATDRVVLLVSVFGIALHPLVVGFLLRRIFHNWLDLAPSAAYCPLRGHTSITPGVVPGASYLPKAGVVPYTCGGFADWSSHLALPWLTFAIFFLPMYTRIIRTRVLETLDEPHVATARAKGASEGRVLRRHVLRIALLPLISMVAMDIGGALMAAIYIEVSFGFNGIGHLVLNLLESDQTSFGFDLPLIVGVFFVIGLAIVVLNLVADVLHYLLEPRVRLRGASA